MLGPDLDLPLPEGNTMETAGASPTETGTSGIPMQRLPVQRMPDLAEELEVALIDCGPIPPDFFAACRVTLMDRELEYGVPVSPEVCFQVAVDEVLGLLDSVEGLSYEEQVYVVKAVLRY